MLSDYKFSDYRQDRQKFRDRDISRYLEFQHAMYGLPAEVGEVTGLFQKQIQGHEVDPTNLVEELGDVLWMLDELCESLGLPLEYIAQYNISKLNVRYPNGFTKEASVNRSK